MTNMALKGWVVIRKKCIDPWEGIQGEFDTIAIHPSKDDAEWTREAMTHPNDWEVREVSVDLIP